MADLEDLIRGEELDNVVRVVRRGETMPRCHYCGNESWDLVKEVVGGHIRMRHSATALRDGGCQPPPEGWKACYRCERMLAPKEYLEVTLRMDSEDGEVREDRVETKKVLVGYEPIPIAERTHAHNHNFPGAQFDSRKNPIR